VRDAACPLSTKGGGTAFDGAHTRMRGRRSRAPAAADGPTDPRPERIEPSVPPPPPPAAAEAAEAACCGNARSRHSASSAAERRWCAARWSTCQRDETCPISTEGWTRRVHFVREGVEDDVEDLENDGGLAGPRGALQQREAIAPRMARRRHRAQLRRVALARHPRADVRVDRRQRLLRARLPGRDVSN